MKIKKNTLIFLTLIGLILIIGIFFLSNKKNEFSLKEEIDFNINKDVNVKIGDFALLCNISRSQENITNIEVKFPETLKGLKFSFLGDHQEMRLNKIVNKSQDDMLPLTSFPNFIFKILNHASKQEERYGKINSTIEGLNYILELDNNRKIKSIKSPSINLLIDF